MLRPAGSAPAASYLNLTMNALECRLSQLPIGENLFVQSIWSLIMGASKYVSADNA